MVHRSKMATGVNVFAVQLLRDHIGQKVYPAHRLDRKTAGVLLFSKDLVSNRTIQMLFQNHQTTKIYEALVRGYTEASGTIDYDLTNEGKTKEAITDYHTQAHYEIKKSTGMHPTSRYSHVELRPHHGRFHQLRKHMAHIRHPILGDRPHGCNKQNRFWKEQYGLTKMMLHARELKFDWNGEKIVIKANQSEEFKRVLSILMNP